MTATTEAKPSGIGRFFYQRTLPIFICALITGVLIVEYYSYSKVPVLIEIRKELLTWGTIVSNFIGLMGTIVIVLGYVRNAQRRTAAGELQWYSVIGVIIFAIWVVLGLSLPGGFDGKDFRMYYLYLVSYCGAAAGLLWLTQTFASYRILRLTNIDMVIFMIGWFAVFARDMPMWTYYIPWLNPFADWYMTVPAISVKRAILIAAAVGSTVLSVRAILMKEPGIIDLEMA